MAHFKIITQPVYKRHQAFWYILIHVVIITLLVLFNIYLLIILNTYNQNLNERFRMLRNLLMSVLSPFVHELCGNNNNKNNVEATFHHHHPAAPRGHLSFPSHRCLRSKKYARQSSTMQYHCERMYQREREREQRSAFISCTIIPFVVVARAEQPVQSGMAGEERGRRGGEPRPR